MLCCVQVRVYELGQLGMKFERHLDAEVVDFQVCCHYAPRHAHPPCCLLAILWQQQTITTRPQCCLRVGGPLVPSSPSCGDSTCSVTTMHTTECIPLYANRTSTPGADTFCPLAVPPDLVGGLRQGGVPVRRPLHLPARQVRGALPHPHPHRRARSRLHCQHSRRASECWRHSPSRPDTDP